MLTYVIHVSTAFERKERLKKQLDNKGLDIHFIVDGDIESISDDTLNQLFKGKMSDRKGYTSCTYKHFLAYKTFLESKEDYAIVFEDDIKLFSNFNLVLPKILAEIKDKQLSNFLISIEDGGIKYVKGSERKRDKILYKKEYGRFAAAYIIDKTFAINCIDYVFKNKFHETIDWFHNHLADHKIIDIYWSHPCLAIQDSVAGNTNSLIDSKKQSLYNSLKFKLSRIYKKILYALR
jgi:glycosyl transferase family 25